jgi:putative membrane-bound dehydrogenase-like protein
MTRGFSCALVDAFHGKVLLMRCFVMLIGLAALLCVFDVVFAATPRVTHERYKLELIAIEPEIVTPTGMAFDSQGRLLVIESHTHERPADYDGPPSDRVRVLSDSDGDGQLDRWITFAEGFRHAMNLLGREDGAVYLVERGRLLLLRDTNNDGAADSQEELLRLETEDDYPHNAIGGIAQHKDGTLVLGLGENHGFSFRLIGSDGKVISGTGGLDGFFRCTADGKNIEHFARGVWNPFSLCVVPDGRIFAVDNDPDASPPCRLLHVVDGGDYGYLYQYGRAGTHPLQAWNGELPGTLPMVCGTGEAPTAVVAHADSLWVTSWGDHRIERYRLVPRGASYGATREVVVQGDADFRPTGMATAPDGSLYFGDWVLRDYPVHGKGRIWRLVLPKDEVESAFPRSSPADLANSGDVEIAYGNAQVNDAFGQASAAWYINHYGIRVKADAPAGLRLSALQAKRNAAITNPVPELRAALQNDSADVRLYAVRWIADDRILELRDEVAKLLDGPQPSTRYYLAVLAAVDWLDHEPSMRGTNITDELLVRELRNDKRSVEAHVLALRHLSPDHAFLTAERLRGYLRSEHSALQLEAVRSLAQQSSTERFALLAEVAGDEAQPGEIRVEAIVGLSADAERHRELMERLAKSCDASVKGECKRVLRLAKLHPAEQENKPPAENLAAWIDVLADGNSGDAAAGRRLFFSPIGPKCGVCHQHSGRGGRVGPDLTYIGRSNNREQIIASILQPSREVAPHYQPWVLVTSDGKTYAGLRQPQGGDNGVETYVDSAGNEFKLPSDMIEERSASDVSIMPDGLQGGLTIVDLRDLVAFLTETETAGH